MYKSTIILLAAVAAACPATHHTLKEYDQCGGLQWTGGSNCPKGWSCVYQNPWYSQCLPASSSSAQTSSSASPPSPAKQQSSVSTSPTSTSTVSEAASTMSASSTSSTSVYTSTAPVSSTSTSTSEAPASTSASSGGGRSFKSSFTFYGAGDTFGSGNCNTKTTACGFFTSPGFAAAVSQNLYGVDPGAGAGPTCGTCWRLTGEVDSNGQALANAGNSIVVMANNLCPAEGNPLCAQNGLTGTNQYGANVNFDLCEDSGARAAFFGNDGTGLAVGTATEVDCSEWSGTVQH